MISQAAYEAAVTTETARGSRVKDAARRGAAVSTMPWPVTATPVDASRSPNPRLATGEGRSSCTVSAVMRF